MCLMLSAAMMMPAALPCSVFAEISTQSAEDSAASQAVQTLQTSQTSQAGKDDFPSINNEANSGSEMTAGGAADGAETAAAMNDAALSDQSEAEAAKQNEGSSEAAESGSAEKNSGLNIKSLIIGGSVSEEASGAVSIESETKQAKTIKLDDRKIKFSKKVIKGSYLGDDYVPQNVKIKAYKTKIKLSWTAPNETDIDGYIIIRRNLEQPEGEDVVEEWTELTRVASDKLSYTDTTASVKDTEYMYAVCAYKTINSGTKISHISDWASGITTKSSKVNVYSLSLSKPAKTTAVSKGKTVKISPTFPSKPYTKTLRWSSSDESKATVSAKGKVKGLKKGTVTITAKMHTGETFKTKVRIVKPGTSAAMITVMKSWMGYSYSNGNHKGIIDLYNSMTPLPVGYTMKYNDAWCDASVSAAAIVAGCTELTGRECSVPRHITIFKNLGIWEENGKITPDPGDLIIFSWKKSTQPNNASASHIGIVESVKDGVITTIEGNKGSGEVARRYIPVGWGYIRGYARPNYSK